VVETLVLGLGNILLGDEGVGVRAVERLLSLYDFPPGTRVLDGGTLGLDLLPYVEDTDRLLLIDAVQAGLEPGSLVRLEGEKVPAFLAVKVSPHQMGLPDLLAAARLQDRYPEKVVLWGVQPGEMRTSLDLSPPVAARMDALLDRVLAELHRWGIEPTRRPEREQIRGFPLSRE
jgi:hydrogenase maturation protease